MDRPLERLRVGRRVSREGHVKTRCSVCGFRYSGRRVGDVCLDRSAAIKRAVREGRNPDTALPCRGLLVRPDDYRFYNHR
jgi:hypothetical protein